MQLYWRGGWSAGLLALVGRIAIYRLPKGSTMTAEYDALVAAAQAVSDEVAADVPKIQALTAANAEASADNAKLPAITAQLNAAVDALKSALG